MLAVLGNLKYGLLKHHLVANFVKPYFGKLGHHLVASLINSDLDHGGFCNFAAGPLDEFPSFFCSWRNLLSIIYLGQVESGRFAGLQPRSQGSDEPDHQLPRRFQRLRQHGR